MSYKLIKTFIFKSKNLISKCSRYKIPHKFAYFYQKKKNVHWKVKLNYYDRLNLKCLQNWIFAEFFICRDFVVFQKRKTVDTLNLEHLFILLIPTHDKIFKIF